MYKGTLVFAQLMSHVLHPIFQKCVDKYQAQKSKLNFPHYDQFLSMAFAHLAFTESLRDIETCLRTHKTKLYHLGIRGGIDLATLSRTVNVV